MNSLTKSLLRTVASVAVSIGLAVAAQAAANPKAGDHPNPRSSEPHPGDAKSAEGKARAEENKEAARQHAEDAHDKSALDRYDTNHNGKLDPDEIAAMQADKKANGKGQKKGKK